MHVLSKKEAAEKNRQAQAEEAKPPRPSQDKKII
jgi:hypothetical protein